MEDSLSSSQQWPRARLWEQEDNPARKPPGEAGRGCISGPEGVLKVGSRLHLYKGGFETMRKEVFRTSGRLQVNLMMAMQRKTPRGGMETRQLGGWESRVTRVSATALPSPLACPE